MKTWSLMSSCHDTDIPIAFFPLHLLGDVVLIHHSNFSSNIPTSAIPSSPVSVEPAKQTAPFIAHSVMIAHLDMLSVFTANDEFPLYPAHFRWSLSVSGCISYWYINLVASKQKEPQRLRQSQKKNKKKLVLYLIDFLKFIWVFASLLDKSIL